VTVSKLKIVLVAFDVNPAAKMFVVVKELLTAKLVKRPTDVMLGWAACETTKATLALATFPTKLDEFMFEIPDPLETTKRPWTFRPVSVPTDVMFPWAAKVTD
jgi:hypothetical protein